MSRHLMRLVSGGHGLAAFAHAKLGPLAPPGAMADNLARFANRLKFRTASDGQVRGIRQMMRWRDPVQPAIGYDDLTRNLTKRFRYRYEGDPSALTRMVGIVFARPNSSLAKEEIIPQINDWHFRSGEHIDFFFAGYTYPHPLVAGYQEVAIPASDPWLYSAERFDAFRQEIEFRTSWRYSGGCDLLLTNSRFDKMAGKASLDFSSTICCQLDTMKGDDAIQSVEPFFEAVFRFAESADDSDPIWGFSDSQGLHVAGSALKRIVLSFLPKELGADYQKAEHFAVQNVGHP